MTETEPLQRVEDALTGLGRNPKRNADQIDARCPAHDDDSPSLSVTYDRAAGKVLVNCHAGCSPDAVIAELGLTWSDLFDQPGTDTARRPEIVATYDYCDEKGEVLYQKIRYAPKDFRVRRPDGRGGFTWKIGDARRVLYRLPEVRDAIAAGKPVLVVEGEKDADRAAAIGLVATTNFEGAASDSQRPKWRPGYSAVLRGANVLVVADNDTAGFAHAEAVAASLVGVAATVGVFRPAVDTPKADLSDHLDAGFGVEDLIAVNVSAATSLSPAGAPRPLTAIGGGQDTTVHPDVIAAVRLPILPMEFWEARKVHAQIRAAAHSRLASADLVLHVVLARLAAMRSHQLVFDSGRGPSSLNYFAAMVGASGIGKTTGADVAPGLAPPPGYLDAPHDPAEPIPFADGLPIGSGEGIAEAFMGTREVEVGQTKNGDPMTRRSRAMVRHNALVLADEGEVFTRVGERKGATVGGTLRSAWSGATIGQANGRDETTRIIPARSYALGLVVGFQPATALPLLADTATGMAQRFAWVSAVDPTIPDEVDDHPGALDLPALVDPDSSASFPAARTGTMPFPVEVVAELRAGHLAKVRGQVVVPERDSQGPLMRCKMAALLALLDARVSVTSEDWSLAALLWDTSCAVRDAVTDAASAEKAQQAELVAQARVQMAERQAAAIASVPAKIDRLAAVLAARVVENGGLRRKDARGGMRSDERHLYDQVVERAAELNLLRVADSGGLLPPRLTAAS